MGALSMAALNMVCLLFSIARGARTSKMHNDKVLHRSGLHMPYWHHLKKPYYLMRQGLCKWQEQICSCHAGWKVTPP